MEDALKEEVALALQQAIEFVEGRSTLGPGEHFEMAWLIRQNWTTFCEVLLEHCGGDTVVAYQTLKGFERLLQMGQPETDTRQ